MKSSAHYPLCLLIHVQNLVCKLSKRSASAGNRTLVLTNCSKTPESLLKKPRTAKKNSKNQQH